MKKAWKIIGIVCAAIVLVVAALLYWSTWEGSTKDIEAVANQLKVQNGWIQVTNQVTPPRNLCLGDTQCPSLHRSWKTKANLTKDDFHSILTDSNWTFNVEGDCEPSQNITSSGGQTLCSAEGVKEGYSIKIVVSGDYGNNTNGHLSLFIEKNNE